MNAPQSTNVPPIQPQGEAGTSYTTATNPTHAMPASRYAFDPRSKSPIIASFLSLCPGLGQAYIGYYGLAFTHILVVAVTITLVAQAPEEITLPLLPIFLAFFWLYNIVDAGRRAALYNHALQGGGDLDLSAQTAALPNPTGGSFVAGGVLVIGGLMAFLHTKFGFSLEWVQDFWPLGPIAFGAWLIYQAAQDRREQAETKAAARRKERLD